MMTSAIPTIVIGVVMSLVTCMTCNARDDDDLNRYPAIVPAPASVKMSEGELLLGERIVVAQAELRPLAAILADEIRLLTGKKLSVSEGNAQANDIRLAIDEALEGEAYVLDVGDMATVRGGNYNAVALGTVSLLQALSAQGNVVKLPHMTVNDEPFAAYRGLLVDLARRWHELDTVKQVIVMCRWYKICYLQLHLTDDQSCVFPSKAYPKAATPGRHYTLKELRELEAFARARGVAIVPELEAPGHSGALRRALPQLNCTTGGRAICPGKESTYEVLGKVISEMCDVFQTTPYFHIGCDEVSMGGWSKCTDCKAYMAKHQLDGERELYRQFIVRMNKVIKQHGKKTIIWEGFHEEGKVDIPRDITVMMFECYYNTPQDVIRAGYPVINTSWQPIYVVNKRAWSPQHIYRWNMYRWEHWHHKSAAYGKGIDVEPTEQVLGAQMCAWEQPDELEIPSLRQRLPAMSERIWNPDAKRDFKDFSRRLNVTDAALTKLLQAQNK